MEYEGMDGYEYREDQPKWPLRRIIRWVICGISILVYLVIFVRLFMSRAPGFANSVLYDAKAKAAAENGTLAVRRVDLPTDSDDDGRVQVIFATYLENADEYQFSLKMNRSYFAFDDYYYILRKNTTAETESERSETLYYKDYFFKYKWRFGYDFARLSFTGITLEKDDTLTLLAFPKDYSGEYLKSESAFSMTVYSNAAYTKQINSFDISEM